MSEIMEALSRKPFAIVGHRGSSASLPENTVAAVRSAVEAGADVVEVDVRRTADNAIVTFHDEDLSRLLGVNRKVREVTLSELRGYRINGEPIPTLEEVISTVDGKAGLFVEVKDPEDTGAVIDEVKSKGASSWTALISFYPEAVRTAASAGLVAGLIYMRPPGQVIEAHRIGARLVLPIHGLATAAAVGLAHRMRLKVVAWTVNDPKVATELVNRGVDAIATDDPAVMVRLRRSWSPTKTLE